MTPDGSGPLSFFDAASLMQSPCCKILASISDGVCTIDCEKRITYLNQAAEKLTGFSAVEAIGRFCFDIFRADICERSCALERTLQGGVPQFEQPATIIHKNGSIKHIRLNTAVLKNERNVTIGAVEIFRDVTELEALRRQVDHRFRPDGIVGRHPKITEMLSFLPDIAESDSTVIIEGPTGTGKELVARAIHRLSRRHDGPFVAINCAALPDSLLESELFGYAKGAFTGALTNKPGRFQAAHGGTLFLDEIADTSLNFQADLLRVLQDGWVIPLGSNHGSSVDVRIIAAGGGLLAQLVEQGRFRRDLYYRLNVVKISLPALSERKQDLLLLAEHFIRRFNLSKKRDIQGISDRVLAFFMDYSFPGNIRELENIIEFCFITCKGSVIDLQHLPKELFSGAEVGPPLLSAGEREEAEKIRLLLRQTGGRRGDVARLLGVGRTTLWRKLKKYGLDQESSGT